MRYALHQGVCIEAQPNRSAECRVCGDAMIAKCGEHRVWHWAHKGQRLCDPWWENETQWHRGWKDHFPKEWQEVIRHAENGEKHIADVMTPRSLFIEFQHSLLKREERHARESFYGNLLWIVDGLRRMRDNPQFLAALGTAQVINLNPLTFTVPSNGALLRDWAGSRAPVFFDFGEAFEAGHPFPFDAPVLWRLNPASPEGTAQLSPVAKENFIAAALHGAPYVGIDLSHLAQNLSAIQQREARSGFDPLAVSLRRRRL